MRILCLTARLPYPPNRGDRLRAYHFIKSLSREHELHLLSFISNAEEYVYLEKLKSYCKDIQVVKMSKGASILSVGTNIWNKLPLQVLYYKSKAMEQLVKDKVASKPFDAAYIHLFRMAPYLTDAPGIYRIVDLTDVISREIARSLPYRSLPSRLLYTIEYPRIDAYEKFVASQFDEVWLIADADQRALHNKCPGANIQVVTNGVDTHLFFQNGDNPHPNSIIFTGHFGVAHNIDAASVLAQQVLPLVQDSYPESTLYLVGAEPSPDVLKLDDLPGVHVAGFVPDLNAYLNRSAVFAAPLRFAAGIQNKVLEAMATARPVITTSIVNEGLGAQPGVDIIIADTPQEMARQIIRLFQQPSQAQSLGLAGQRFVQNKFSWDLVLQRVNKIEDDLRSCTTS
jgi:sugar transferase (PEP-CTERM/EpsH1 system associated)